MFFLHEFLLIVSVPLAMTLALLVGHLATLRGLRGSQRVAAFRIFTNAVKRRR
ncbi:hypothetical protein [Streptomyces sp. YS415]|uniref:hypothetical protein n=1 Tax=Streptomyces sp. YS415 TaxID=2944806 RepID=UPI0020204F35|nr:hypothetical protein [Streptomyces sp. YS415]MCL7423923.1 hypothetical protein [Streptomyces sp. YS415]